MPDVVIRVSRVDFVTLSPANRKRLGDELRVAAAPFFQRFGLGIQNVSAPWQCFDDGQNTIDVMAEVQYSEGPDGFDLSREERNRLQDALLKVLRETAILDILGEISVGVWVLPQPDAVFGSDRRG